MTISARIRDKLTAAFTPLSLDLEDESAKHAGHAAMKGLAAGETHFRLAIVSDRFRGTTRVQRQRMIYQVLAAELADGVHALAIQAQSPDEVTRV